MCGIIAIKNHPDAAELVRLGLHNLQHRGEESVGMASSDGLNIKLVKKMGLVGDVITDNDCKELSGNMAIGQVRYSTQGKSIESNMQPLYAKLYGGELAIVHNGHIARASGIREKLEKDGSIFQTTTDTEIILHLMAKSKKDDNWNKLHDSLKLTSGAYSLAILSKDDILIARDKCGIRPLIIGKIGDALIVASESCAIDVLGGEIIRDVEPGEQLSLSVPNVYFLNKKQCLNNICVFEYIYFARPDSIMEGKSIHSVRMRLGKQLAKEQPVNADVCIAVPDSGVASALGYSEVSGVPYVNGILRTHYAGRTFIQPGQILRNRKIRMKLNPVISVVQNKSVVVIDDSIVRGNTSRRVVEMLRIAGAREIHLRVSSPPVKFPCYYGIDTPEEEELIASNCSIDDIREIIKCDSLGYLSYNGMVEAIGLNDCCDACFNGKYLI